MPAWHRAQSSSLAAAAGGVVVLAAAFAGAGAAGCGGADSVAESFAGAADVAATPVAPVPVAGLATAGTLGTSLPRTSMISRSGSRSEKLVTRPMVPTSRTTRTVDVSYWPTRICCSNPDLTGHCFPTSIEFNRAGAISMKTRSGPFASPCVKLDFAADIDDDSDGVLRFPVPDVVDGCRLWNSS